ncbi:MAG: hypothetical protein ACFFBD_01405, partial [Candidatus Hodarchaeota archaeon]
MDLNIMKDLKIKIIAIGDGGSGKTQIFKTFAQGVKEAIELLFDKYMAEQNQISYQKWYENQRDELTATFEDIIGLKTGREDYYRWLERKKLPTPRIWTNVHKFTTGDVEKKSTDIATGALEQFQMCFPYQKDGSTYRVMLEGFDFGGQNVFDHIRNIYQQLSKPGDITLTVFDSTRLTSCRNSVNHINNFIDKIKEQALTGQKLMPTIITVSNKEDLLEYISSSEWQNGFTFTLMQKLSGLSQKTSVTYTLPYLREEHNKTERIITAPIINGQINYADIESIIYETIRKFDTEYLSGRMTDVN